MRFLKWKNWPEYGEFEYQFLPNYEFKYPNFTWMPIEIRGWKFGIYDLTIGIGLYPGKPMLGYYGLYYNGLNVAIHVGPFFACWSR